MDRLNRNAGGTLTLLSYDGSGVLTDLASTPTVVVKNSAGTTTATGTATRASAGTYTLALTSAQTTTCDTYEATWTGGTDVRVTRFEITGGALCSIADIRASDRALATAAVDVLTDARDRATERFEKAARTAYTRRGRRAVLTGTGTTRLIPPDLDIKSILSVTVDGVAWDATEVRIGSGDILYAPSNAVWTYGAEIVIRYEYGLDDVPEPVRFAVRDLAKMYAVPSLLPERATALSTDVGSFRMTIAGRDGFTGLPEVDEVIRQFGKPAPAVGAVSW